MFFILFAYPSMLFLLLSTSVVGLYFAIVIIIISLFFSGGALVPTFAASLVGTIVV